VPVAGFVIVNWLELRVAIATFVKLYWLGITPVIETNCPTVKACVAVVYVTVVPLAVMFVIVTG
jgi:hypothetical protein